MISPLLRPLVPHLKNKAVVPMSEPGAILGLSFETHHHGAALMRGGRILMAVAEESLSRIKADNATPRLAVSACLRSAGVKPEEIDTIAIAGLPPAANLYYFSKQVSGELADAGWEGLRTLIYHAGDRLVIESGLRAALKRLLLCTGVPQFIILYWHRLYQILRELPGFRGEIVFVDHHVAHLALPYYLSGFSDCLSVVVEGLDKIRSLSLDVVRGGTLAPVAQTPWPASPGYYYRFITSMLGFCPQTDGGKVMGLASYGRLEPRAVEAASLLCVDDLTIKMSRKLHRYRHYLARTGTRPMEFAGISRENLAHGFQNCLENVLSEVVQRACLETGVRRLILSGGVAANVRVNQKLHELPEIDEIFVSPAMGDVGLPLGAAIYAAGAGMGRQYGAPLEHIFYGPEYSAVSVQTALERHQLAFEQLEDAPTRVAALLTSGAIVARFTGRLEYGPRALGNRSIMCRPDASTLIERLSRDLLRPAFMPFAPSVLAHHADECFYRLSGATRTARFMNISFQATPRFRALAPAVVHVDGSARPALVDNANPQMLAIIERFFAQSGIPALLNTSFNRHGEPIVCSPDDAIRTFIASDLDYLAIENFLVRHPSRRS